MAIPPGRVFTRRREGNATGNAWRSTGLSTERCALTPTRRAFPGNHHHPSPGGDMEEVGCSLHDALPYVNNFLQRRAPGPGPDRVRPCALSLSVIDRASEKEMAARFSCGSTRSVLVNAGTGTVPV